MKKDRKQAPHLPLDEDVHEMLKQEKLRTGRVLRFIGNSILRKSLRRAGPARQKETAP